MKRTKGTKIQTLSDLQTLSALVQRAALGGRLGVQSYGGDRDLYQALGYPAAITYEDYMSRYLRQDIAKAIIDRPVRATWQGELEMLESSNKEETVFEKGWRLLNKKLGLKTRLSRVDRLTGIGEYGVLLLGLDDVKNTDAFALPVTPGTRKLLYVKPYGQAHAEITSYEEDPKNPRYGLPLIYTIEAGETKEVNAITLKVHYSRVIHIVDDVLESEIKGAPRLEAVFNRLMDLEKIIGGDGEMFWRGARPGYHGKVNPDYQVTPQMQEDLQNQIDEYEHNLRRFLINEGIDLEALTQQLADPTHHVSVQIMMISAVTGIPQRILTGSERGELASSEDRGEWLSYVQTRREEHAEPRIVRVLVDRLIELRVLPAPSEEYTIKWSDLYAQSEKARVEIGKGRALALRDYTLNPMAEAIVPPNAFMEFFLGFTQPQIELINQMREAGMSEEQLAEAISKRIEQEITPAPKPNTESVRTKEPKKKTTE